MVNVLCSSVLFECNHSISSSDAEMKTVLEPNVKSTCTRIQDRVCHREFLE